MAQVVIKKAITTEKSFANQDKKIWTFLVSSEANKGQIKEEIEKLFGVKVESVNTSARRKKVRQMRGSRVHSRRHPGKIARISLKDKKAKIDLTKVKK